MDASFSTGSSSGKRGRDEEEQAGPSKRPARSENRIEGVVRTRPTYDDFDPKPKSFKGGDRFKFQTNYFQVSMGTKWTIHKYHTTFEPECLMSRLKNAMIAQHKEAIGGFLFDGVQLFVTRELPEESLLLVSTTRENVEYRIKLVHTSTVLTNQREYLQVLNLILRRATHGLNLKLVNRNYYDPAAKIDLSQFRIELWPGYETSIKSHDAGILLMADIAHKVMRTDTVYDLLQETLRADPNNFQNSFKQKVLGMTVLTGYNNSCYRIDDVNFSLSPMSTFTKRDEEVQIRQYYIDKYQITIRDTKQPLLITKLKERSLRGGEDRPLWLVPELCRITGLSERQRGDIQLKNAMKPFSQMNPRTRKDRIVAYNNRVRSTPESMNVITQWNLGLQNRLLEVEGHRLKAETLVFGGKRDHTVVNASWDRECGRGLNLFQPVNLKRWYIVFPNQAERDVNKFTKRIVEIGRAMGFEISTPRERKVANDRALATDVDSIKDTKPQMICFVVTSNKNSNADIYSAIKKRCFCDNAIASQVVTRFILSKDKGYDSVVTKIAIQMCSKLGGAPWSVRIPMAGIMTVGFDVSKDSQNKNMSFGCLVATMDLKESVDFFATVASYSNTETLSKEFGIAVIKAINAFKKKHERLPGKIIIYRGGCGDGDLAYMSDVEVKQLEAKLKDLYAQCDAKPELIFIIVSKKINSRIFEGDNNPKAGSVVDSMITMEERMEFFLVSVESRQGTVTPVNYNIIHDSTGEKFGVDKMQIWTYKHTHLYYNWTGTTKVPAVLQYATKLCFMVCNFMHRVPNSNLENSLYFL